MKCADIEKAIKDIDELIKEHERLEEIGDRTVSVLDDLKPRFKKTLKDLKKLWKSLKKYFDDSESELSDAERIKKWKQAREILQKKYENCVNTWTGEISVVTSVSKGIMNKELIARTLTLVEFRWHEEHKWKIIGKPANIADESFVDYGKVTNCTYPALWTGVVNGKWAYTSHIKGASTVIYTCTGKTRLSTSVTIKNVGRNYILIIPAGQVEVSLQTISPTLVNVPWPPLKVEAQTIEGKLDSGGLVIKGVKGPLSIPARMWRWHVKATWTKTLKWKLTRKKSASKKPGRNKPSPL